MNEDRVVYATKYKRDVKVITSKNSSRKTNFACQYDSKRDKVICTCKRVIKMREDVKYFASPKQVFACHGSRSHADIGVGSIKVLQKKRVRRVYAPETDDRGVGSTDLTEFVGRKSRYPKFSYYDHKRTSSKCVGGILEYNTGCVVSEKLSPIVQTRSGATSPNNSLLFRNTQIGSNTIYKKLETTGTQFDYDINKSSEITTKTVDNKEPERVQNVKEDRTKNNEKKAKKSDAVGSSDSIVQHIHDLESQSDEKDPMENKLEREYRKLFSTKPDSKISYDRPLPEFKSASVLKRRFEALKRGLIKKDDSNSKRNNLTNMKIPAQDSLLSHKDVSITSDPPSLIARSFSNIKKFSPVITSVEDKNRESKNEAYRTEWPENPTDSESQGVKGMFKLWGKKFNLEEDTYKKQATPLPSFDVPEKTKKDKSNPPKKEGKKFFSFKRKGKDKNKESYQSKKDVTAGRCEIKDGFTFKLEGAASAKDDKVSRISEENVEITRRAWLRRFLSQSIESARSVNVRWNNSLYTTSSSTAFELLETVFKKSGTVFRSQSEITTEDSSLYKSYTQHKVNFIQDIEAWMVPTTIQYRPKEIPFKIHSNKEANKNITLVVSDQKWYIEKSEAFANKIQVVLNSKYKEIKASSEYLRIDIPKDFLYASSSDSKRNVSSDEKVYKIVEYETNSEIKSRKEKNELEKGDHLINDVRIIVSVQDSNYIESKILDTNIRPSCQRDVVIQGSKVNIPKRCGVISVGVITQDLREIRKPILKIQDYISDEETDHASPSNQKKYEYAESYLQDCYRHWTPLDVEQFSSCLNDSHPQSGSEKSTPVYHNQGDGSRSYLNIYDDFQGDAIVSSCNTSSCSHCAYDEKDKATITSKILNKFKKKPSGPKPETDVAPKRTHPKDSVEVFKRRRIYASSNKSQWNADEPNSFPSSDSKGGNTQKKSCKKHVLLPDCKVMDELLAKQLEDKVVEGILAFKSAGCEACKKGTRCEKHAVVQPKVSCVIPQPPCKVSCEKIKTPPCNKSKTSCNVSPRSSPPCATPVCLKPSHSSPCSPPPCSPPPCSPPCKPPTPPCKPSPSPSIPECISKLWKSYQKSPPCSRSCSPPKNVSPCSTPCKKCSKNKSPPQKKSPCTSCCSPRCKKVKKSPCKKTPTKCSRSDSSCQSSPKGSKQASPKTSHDCLSPKSSILKVPQNICSPKTSGKLQKCPSNTSIVRKSPTSSPKRTPSRSSIPGLSLVNNPKPPKSPKRSPCRLPPCNQIKKEKPKNPSNENEEFPWPTNSQTSNPPSPKRGNSLTCPPKKSTSQCKKNCSMKARSSSQSLVPEKEKQCRPDCANRKKVKPVPAKENPVSPKTNKNKISGLFLKMKPSKKKTCAEDCLSWDSEKEQGVVKLNSRERITIKLRQQSPSTEEIREGMNIKVQDEDGKTIYERKDYTRGKHKPSVLGDMYRDSNINRALTPTAVTNMTKDTELTGYKDNKSVDNLIEIQLKLRITQGDKTTEVNIGNENAKQDQVSEVEKTSPEVFYVKNGTEAYEDAPKDDVSIKIIIKNYKPRPEIINKDGELFSKKISNKFNTVSTGYSDVITEPNEDQVFSIHRTTVDLASSLEKTITLSKTSHERSKDFTENEQLNTASSHSTEQIPIDMPNDNLETKSVTSKKESLNCIETDTYITELPDYNKDKDRTNVYPSTSSEYNNELNNREEKKQLLKKVIKIAHKTEGKNKEEVRQLRQMLKIILTDSSEDDTNENKLAKDVTFTSLKPNYFRNTDSMNNYYKLDSNYSISEKLNPTADDSEVSSESNVVYQSCMCSKVAEKLKTNISCCCRKIRQDETTSCCLKHDDVNKIEFKDIETQNSSSLDKSKDLNVSDARKSVVEMRPEKEHEIINLVPISKTFSNRKCESKISLKSHSKIDNEMDNSNKNKVDDLKITVCEADILQSYETKKAVLLLYAEKTDVKDRLVAKLPKFVFDIEDEITKQYRTIARNS